MSFVHSELPPTPPQLQFGLAFVIPTVTFDSPICIIHTPLFANVDHNAHTHTHTQTTHTHTHTHTPHKQTTMDCIPNDCRDISLQHNIVTVIETSITHRQKEEGLPSKYAVLPVVTNPPIRRVEF